VGDATPPPTTSVPAKAPQQSYPTTETLFIDPFAPSSGPPPQSTNIGPDIFSVYNSGSQPSTNDIFSSPPINQSSQGFPSLAGSGGGFIKQVMPGGNYDIGNFNENAAIRDYLKGKRLSHSTTQKLYENESFRIGFIKAYHDNQLITALFSTNKSGSAITDISYTFALPPTLSIAFIPDEVHSSSDLRSEIKSLPATMTSILFFQTDQTSFEYNLPCTITASFKVGGQLQYARFSLPYSPMDFVRKLDLDINSYGKMWTQFTRECKQALPNTTITTPEVYESIISETNFKVISIRGNEVVSCSRTSKAPSEELLLYAKIVPHQLILLLRTKDSKLTDSIGLALKNIFSNK
jgi:hypothetical protein